MDRNINDLIKNAIVLDCHNDTLLKVIDDNFKMEIDLGKETNFHIDLLKMERVGFNVGYFSAFTRELGSFEENNNKILALINALHLIVLKNKNKAEIPSTLNDIQKILNKNKICLVPTIEGAYSINESNYKYLTKQYQDIGVKVIGYVWNDPNELGYGIKENDLGLTGLGIEYTKYLNDLGIVIDTSHMNEKTFYDTINISRSPVIASHSSVRSLVDHVRNLRDDQIIKLKENNGVININFWKKSLNDNQEAATYIDIVDHIDYVKELVGIDYVGLGSDFDGASMPKGIDSCLDLYKIVMEMQKRKYSEDEIRKVLGLNNLRVLKEVEKNRKIDLDNNIKIEFDQDNLTFRIDEDNYNYKIIYDGLVIEENCKNIKEIKVDKSLLNEKYHVLSLEIEKDNKISRHTKIIR